MEALLESNRFSSCYNAGESGHCPQKLDDLLSGLQTAFSYNLREALLDIPLSDAPNMGTIELRGEVASLHPGASIEHVLITTGTSEAFFLLMRQLRPSKVAVITPAFQLLTEIPRSQGAKVVSLGVIWDELGRPIASIREWVKTIVTERPDVLILNHPHNPTGLTFSAEQLSELTEAAESVQCCVVGDEHYRFLHSNEALGPTVYSEGRFVTGSFIKCSGTPGLRVGWCVGDPSVLREMQSEKNYLTHTVNPLSQKLSYWFLNAFSRQQDYFQRLRNDWLANRARLESWFQEQSLWQGQPPQGGLVTCIFPNPNHKSILLKRLNDFGVFLLPLSTFRESHECDERFFTSFRLGLGLSQSQFNQMLSVMVP
jgi:aspartate/methionine/tyrosine aminotransferase